VSEKNQKLFLKAEDPVTGFRELDLERLIGEPTASVVSPVETSEPPVFALSQSFWLLLGNDPELRREFDRQIEIKAEALMHETLEREKAKAIAIATAEGRKLGFDEAQTQLNEITSQLETIVAETLNQRATLLREHEAEWLRTFSRLLERFLVPQRNLAVDYLTTWLRDSLGTLEESGKVWIFLATPDFKKLESSLRSLGEGRWEISEDMKLAPGEIRCECDRGGAIFSPSEQMTKLEEWIARFTQPSL
jgi:flagellar biosynthesis/type III secretory pathway protein FliH